MKARRFLKASCKDCATVGRMFVVNWPQGVEELKEHLMKEHSYELTEKEIAEVNIEAKSMP